MYVLARTLMLMAVTLSALVGATAQTIASQSKEANASGSIAGRVTLGGKPAAGIPVMLMSRYGDPRFERAFAKTTTDQDGHFQIAQLPAGRYSVLTFAPAYCLEIEPGHDPDEGKAVVLAEGESVDGIALALRRGGVITGRVSDTEGRPLVQQMVSLRHFDSNGRQLSFYSMNYRKMMTDDRGVYRIYGLPAGRYLVSVGVSGRRYGNAYYPRTYHPGVTDESKATVVEVAEGVEATGVDILMGSKEKAYLASGRIADAETGKPMPNASYGYGVRQPYGPNVEYLHPQMWGLRTDARGEFRIEGITPGRYAIMVGQFGGQDDGNEMVGENTSFEISDTDVANLEVRVRRGSSISGAVTVEGANEEEIPALLSTIRLRFDILTNPFQAPSTRINPDGSFRLAGVPPSHGRIYINNLERTSGLSLLRVERDGNDQTTGIEVATGENIAGVRVVLAYGTGVIRGQVKLGDDALPSGAEIYLSARRIGDSHSGLSPQTAADSRGHFVFEHLPPGQYEVIVSDLTINIPGQPPRRFKEPRQTVSVTNGTETNVRLVVEREAKNN